MEGVRTELNDWPEDLNGFLQLTSRATLLYATSAKRVTTEQFHLGSRAHRRSTQVRLFFRNVFVVISKVSPLKHSSSVLLLNMCKHCR